jgi:pimeloyl-ACP methyl ester carboxylesterase
MLKEYHIYHWSYKIFCIQNISYADEVPLFFVHGFGVNSKDFFEAFYNEYLQDMPIFIMDLLGYGKSDKPHDFSYDLTKQAQAIYAVIKSQGIKKVNLVAHSMGGVICSILAQKHPELVEKLILVEGGIFPHKNRIAESIVAYESEANFTNNYDNFVKRYYKPDNPVVYHLYKLLTKTEPYVLYKSAVSMVKEVNDDFYQSFLKLDIPRYYIYGEKSYYDLTGDIKKDFKQNGIKLYMVPKANHNMMASNPEDFFGVLYDIIY